MLTLPGTKTRVWQATETNTPYMYMYVIQVSIKDVMCIIYVYVV